MVGLMSKLEEIWKETLLGESQYLPGWTGKIIIIIIYLNCKWVLPGGSVLQ
jgi:hypothetical protein